ARERCDVQPDETPRVMSKPQAGDVPVKIDGKVGNALQILGVALAKMRRQNASALFAELKVRRVHAAVRQTEGRAEGFRPGFRIVINERSGFDERLRAREIAFNLAARKRPARPRQPI